MGSNPFISPGVWLRGNLHSHTTESDGRLTPEEVVKYYAQNDYDFLALTDHEKITKIASSRLLLISGTEVAVGQGILGDSYHVMAMNVGDNDALQKHKGESIDSLLAYVSDIGGVAFIAHPYWSRLTTSDLSSIGNYIGVEVYNTGCDVLVAKGFSNVHWDDLLVQGKRTYGFAVDDGHWYPVDSAGGWVWVKARERSLEAVLDSIRSGLFYSTMGPSIGHVSFSGGRFEAKFSPVRRVDVISEGGIGFSASYDSYEKVKRVRNEMIKVKTREVKKRSKEVSVEMGPRRAHLIMKDQNITALSLEGVPFRTYLRLEITDAEGKKAWSNPIFL